MFKWKNSCYVLDVYGVSYWKKVPNKENKIELYTQHNINEHYKLYFEKIAKNKYLDLVTRRLFTINTIGNYILILPSYILTKKSFLSKITNVDAISIVNSIIENEKEEYISISEDIIYNSNLYNKAFAELELKNSPFFVNEELNKCYKRNLLKKL